MAFEVSGIITLTRSIKITRSNTTVAGQTAPLDQRSGFHADGVATPGISNIVFVHLSAAWTTDQTFLVWRSGGPRAELGNVVLSSS